MSRQRFTRTVREIHAAATREAADLGMEISDMHWCGKHPKFVVTGKGIRSKITVPNTPRRGTEDAIRGILRIMRHISREAET